MGTVLKQADSVKYLGLVMDKNSTWEQHITKVSSESTKYTSIFAKLRHHVPRDCLQVLFDSLVQSKINYALELYGQATDKHLKQIQVTQNRIIKILQFKNRRESTNIIHKTFGVLKVKDQFETKILKIMHQVKFNTNSLPLIFQSYFETNEGKHKYITRQNTDFRIEKAKRRWGNFKIKNIGARLWNNLPKLLKTISSQKHFVKKLKIDILSKYQQIITSKIIKSQSLSVS